ncbi:hypothetical protein [Achromobacter aegrifaciens]
MDKFAVLISPASGKPPQFMLNNIQALRAIAALLVVLHHAGAHYAAMGGENAVII